MKTPMAGNHGLSKLIVFYDQNFISIEGDTHMTYTDDVNKRMEAGGGMSRKLTDIIMRKYVTLLKMLKMNIISHQLLYVIQQLVLVHQIKLVDMIVMGHR